MHHFVTERRLADMGLVNYWGYDSIGFFAPDVRYATGGRGEQVAEFKSMVKRLHRAGLEVILDVVYNHTAEGNHLGPTLCFRGIDNDTYYRLDPERPRYYTDWTGTGNTVDVRHSRALQLVMDSLRYWVAEMHVDGFRFDLAPVLARGDEAYSPFAEFFDVVRQDPVVSQVKLIAEPWDLGPGGYQVGNFPIGWSEWNGKYRDTVRQFWRGDQGQVGQLASRLAGSSDLYEHSQRSPLASINFVTCHDGFTLHDLVSYEQKHNEANGEDNRDGSDNNLSRNWGAEGPTDAVHVGAHARAHQAESPGHAGVLSGRAHDLPRRRAGSHPGRQQQRLLPGQPGILDRLEPFIPIGAIPRVHPGGVRDAGAQSRSPPPHLLPAGGARRRGEGPRLAPSGRRRR